MEQHRYPHLIYQQPEDELDISPKSIAILATMFILDGILLVFSAIGVVTVFRFATAWFGR